MCFYTEKNSVSIHINKDVIISFVQGSPICIPVLNVILGFLEFTIFKRKVHFERVIFTVL